MKNLSRKIVALSVFCALTIVQVSATPMVALKIKKNDSQISQITNAYTIPQCIKTWLLSLLNKKDYVAEDSLLNNYMLGRSDKKVQLSEAEESLLSNYMYGNRNDSITYFYNSEEVSFATELDDEYACEDEFFEE